MEYEHFLLSFSLSEKLSMKKKKRETIFTISNRIYEFTIRSSWTSFISDLVEVASATKIVKINSSPFSHRHIELCSQNIKSNKKNIPFFSVMCGGKKVGKTENQALWSVKEKKEIKKQISLKKSSSFDCDWLKYLHWIETHKSSNWKNSIHSRFPASAKIFLSTTHLPNFLVLRGVVILLQRTFLAHL